MSPSLDLLRTFLAVHRAGSITAGAERLGLSQPLARRVADPIDALHGLLLDELDAPTAATVHLGGPSDFLCTMVLPALAGRLADGLQVRATFGLPEDLLDRLVDRSLDLVISSTRPRRAGVRATPFYDETFALVAAPKWSAGTLTSSPEPLRKIPLIAYAEEAPIIRRYWRTVFSTRLTRTADLVVPDLRGVLAAVRAGAGASVLPTYLCDEALAAAELVLLSDPELPPLNTLYLATRSSTGANNSTAMVRDRLVRTFSS
ncbi:LysR family transcriptional regulator [Kribbella sp. NPDC003505]|uniref:LysR family transcriptional regulator n=1 Tax=Kribbella sp. NPDC003505 TaxID=3154448 RepID=UPI0033BB3203